MLGCTGQQPGYISTTLHQALDATYLYVNVANWESQRKTLHRCYL
ncbi:antibiotic biosynthesis monooxygenase [Vibrio chagasii]|nr:antibiotic biosynthesis monooxygenase [Vibrio chagasii]